MESLIPNQKGMTSLEIAEVTGKQHAHVMRDIRSLLSQGVSASNFGLGSYTDANGQKRPLFNLTPKGCLILASGYDAVLRERIINRLEYLENEKKVIKTPQTYLEALEALVASEKEKEQLRIETEQQQKQIEQKDAKITKLQPKADFAEAAFKAEGKVDIGQAAKILNLGFGRNTLFGKLFFTASIILYIKYLFYIQKQFAYNLHNKITACHITNLCSRSNLMQKLRS